ncbi:MAG: hypothetical protein IT223_09760 [Crocinitomicaceae bacterium]|nr:hypothetical protein [Crocinitomicaceae bacterium]
MKRRIALASGKTLYVSFGENCLPDNILDRHKLKLLTTPFSHGRSNVEYILQLEKDQYKDLLNPSFLRHEFLEGKEVSRLKKYMALQNSYHELHTNGFEFTHHDVIRSESVRLKMKERLAELLRRKGKNKFVIFYHHRANANTRIELLLEDLKKLKCIYSTSNIQSEIICFTQKIIKNSNERKLIHEILNGIHFFTFYTLNEWAGDDEDIFWARNDEDLIAEMIDAVKKI